MSKICPNCNQILDDSVEKCPFCGSDLSSSNNENKLEDIVEVSTVPEVNAIPESNLVVPPWVDNANEINNSPVSDIVETPTAIPEPVTPIVEEVALPNQSPEQQPVAEPVLNQVPIENNPVSEVTPVEQVVNPPVPEVSVGETPVVEEVAAPNPSPEQQPVTEPVLNQVPIENNPVSEVTPVEQVVNPPVPEVSVGETPVVEEVAVPNQSPEQQPVAEPVLNQVPIENNPVSEVTPVEQVVTSPIIADANNQVNAPLPSLSNEQAFEEVSVDSLPTLQLNTMGPSSNEPVSTPQPMPTMEAPVLPAATIGEVNLDNLASGYARDEELNNERRIERDRQREERMRMEAEAQKNIVIPKPDLLAVNAPPPIDPNFQPLPEPVPQPNIKPKKKPKKRSNHKIILDLLTVVAVIVIIIVFLLLLDKRTNDDAPQEEEQDYMQPIDTYYEGYSNGNSTTMLSAYLPCLATSDDITTSVNIAVTDRLQYKTFKVDHVEERVEVVNTDDKDALKEYVSEQCDVNTPTITEFKYVYIKQSTITEENDKAEESSPKIYVGKVDDKWYILTFQGK